LDSLIHDVRYGLRQLRKTRGLALAVALSLTVGIGANTAIFSLVDAALLRPLPVKDPDALIVLEWTAPAFPEGVSNINGDFRRIAEGRVQASSVGANIYRTLAREQRALAALAGVADETSVALSVDASAAEQVSLQHVSSNFFDTLGVPPVVGRSFRDEDDRVGHEPLLIVSHRLWMRRFGGSRSVLDRTVRINNVPARVVGVAPPAFFGVRAGQWTDVYSPLAVRVAFQVPRPGEPRGENDRDWWVRLFARLNPGIPEPVALQQTAALFRTMAIADGAVVDPKKAPELIALPGHRGFNGVGSRDAAALWTLLLLVGVLLLIVCANVANLLLSRSVVRRRESALRVALGAGRARLVRQQFIESGLLALLGGIGGLAAGYAAAIAIHAMFQLGRAANSAFDLDLHARVLGYTIALSMLTTLLFGLAPAVWATQVDLNDVLKAQPRSVLGGRLRLPRLLVSIQIALCLTALVAAGLLTGSLDNLKRTDLGFDRENLAYATVNPRQAGYSTDRLDSYVDRVRAELAALPGVLGVSPIDVRPLSGNGNLSRISIPGRPSQVERGLVNDAEGAHRNSAGDGLFETLRIPLIAGRTFDRRDAAATTGPVVPVVVDQLFARRFFPNENPLGRRFGFNQQTNNRCEIVGVVGDSRYNSLRADPRPTVYEPYVAGGGFVRQIHFAIRSTIDSSRLAEAVRRAVARVDPAVPLTEFHTQTTLIDRLLRTERLLGIISSAFGVVALALAAIGLAGLLAYAVARRTTEIGVRMALGAAAGDVVAMVLRESLWMVGAGLVIGLPCAYAVGLFLKSALFRLEPADPRTVVIATFVLSATALAAAWVPARRAAAVDPMTALRNW